MVNIPEKIGGFQIRGVLGSGGFATVYRAHDASLDRDVALKVLHPHLASDPALRERFLREGRALARVDHPNVVTVWGAGEEGGSAFLVMKLISGRPLSEIVAQRGPLPVGEVVTITEQVAAALGAVHAQSLVHRDIKPENIMIENGSNKAMLLDLGVARDMANATMTGGLIVGTLGYMAPEQAQASGNISVRTDVYQLGATVFSLLTGRPPFGGTTIQVLDAIIRQPPPDLRQIRPDVPESVVAAIARALAKDPAYRYPSTRDFAGDLRTAVTPQPFQAPPAPIYNGATSPAMQSPPPFPRPNPTPQPRPGPAGTWVAGQTPPTTPGPAWQALNTQSPPPYPPPWATQPSPQTDRGEMFGRRAGAAIIDGIMWSIVYAIVAGIAGGGAAFVLGLIGGWLYYALLESGPGRATLGKRAVGLCVTDVNGAPISFGRASGRFFAKYVSVITLGVGFLMPLFTARAQALHDLIAGTIVVPSKS